MREIVFDVETTGLVFAGGDRIVEIACVELVNRVETGEFYHAYFNPERDMPAEAERIHGLSSAFLSGHPVFATGAAALLEFLGDSQLVAHNATFDFGFLNGELTRCGLPPVCMSRMIDTLALARIRHPGAKHTLDALCSRYGIDRSHRVLHGALVDTQLLAKVYVELTGGRQIGLGLSIEAVGTRSGEAGEAPAPPRPAAAPGLAAPRPPRIFTASEAERAAHAAFVAGIADSLWGANASG